MSDGANSQESTVTAAPLRSRSDLSGILRRACSDMAASHYMLLEPTASRGPKDVRILTSNWLFDWIEDLGRDGIATLLESGHATPAGAAPRLIVSASAPCLSPAGRRALHDSGHAELYCQRINARHRQLYAIFSSPEVGAIDKVALVRSQMMVGYALEQVFAATGKDAGQDPLSERERECLRWVSQGKTTDEVALILGVSSNTVNSYVAHAIQKFGAANRAMAIATAIRSGII